MTSQQKKDFLRQFRKFQAQREKMYTGRFDRILKAQVQQYLSTQNVLSIDFKPMFDELLKLYRDVAIVWGHKVQLSIRRQQSKARQPIGFSQRIFQILKDAYGINLINDAMVITETTRELIKVLTDAALLGQGIDDIVAKLTSPEFTEMRARRIARTETVGAANIAGDIVARDSGLAMNKQWLAVLDSRTRHDHREIHGTLIDINSRFDVHGNMMRFPGDRGTDGITIPGSETINCRCVCVYIPKVDSRGLAMAAP